MPGSPYPTIPGSRDLVVHPSGAFAYVPSAVAGVLSVFGIDSSTGAFSNISGGLVGNGAAWPIARSSHGSVAYVLAASSGACAISALAIDPQTGGFASLPSSPFASRFCPAYIAIDPSSKFAFVADDRAPVLLEGYAIDASSGALTALPAAIPSPGYYIPSSLVILK